jgi:hypothetical protein
MKQKSLTITLIVCAVLVVALLLAVVLISAKSENAAPNDGNEALNVQQGSSSTHSGSTLLPDKDYCMLTVDKWSVEDGILTIDAFAQAMISNDVTASARIELWKNTDVLTAHPITLGEGEASNVYESEVSVQFDVPEMGAEDELQLWFIIELSDDTVLFSSDASFYQEGDQLMIVAG